MSLDRFLQSRAAQVVAFVWGLAEATFFFIVPDVLLMLAGVRALRRALRLALVAVAGALLGGAAMYWYGLSAAASARATLDSVPAVTAGMIESVRSQLGERGLEAVFLGPLRGTPYKIYAVEWGARGGSFLAFLLISVPARGIRFVVSAAAANAAARLLAPWTGRRAWVELTLLALFWLALYGFYFAKFGW